ncbi:MAG TPA: tetratricopeptide repeat protein [Acidimicrobiales bacterium]|nr:tetratricopeptide repeat protein [Acidimicrobiales bacterium]
MSEPTAVGLDPVEAIAALEAELAAIPARHRPRDRGAAAYRLGMAYAEAPIGDPGDNLRRALVCYDVAAKAFDPRFDPVEHARTLNAAGAAHRHLGDRAQAVRLFERAATLLEGRERPEELASVLNNLGLAQTELGEPALAVTAFDQALDLFTAETAQGRRSRVAALHNRGLAQSASGTKLGLEAALDDYGSALAELDPQEAPYHHGLVLHSKGVALSSLAQLCPDQKQSRLGEALSAFGESLAVFAPDNFPFQHAVAKYNQGLAYLGLGGDEDLRRALAAFEDTLAILDPRLHADSWKLAYGKLSETEARLASIFPGLTRADHFAVLVAGCDADERLALIRERLSRLLLLPGPRMADALAEWARGVVRLDREAARRVIESELAVLMLVPNDALEAVLRAQFDAQQQLAPGPKEELDWALDDAVGWALNGPQRVFVRDFLYSLGFERP